MMTTTCALFNISFIPSFCFAERKPNTNLTPWGFIWIFDDDLHESSDYIENLSIYSAAPHLSRGGTGSPSSRTGVCSVLLPTGAYLGWSPLPTLHMYTDNTDMLVIMMAGGYTPGCHFSEICLGTVYQGQKKSVTKYVKNCSIKCYLWPKLL